MGSKEFLDSLINKNIRVYFKDGHDVWGTLVWNESDSIGLHYGEKIAGVWTNDRIVLYFKSYIKSIEVV